MKVNLIGNGDNAGLFKRREDGTFPTGTNVVCNMPPIDMLSMEVYASVMVDFKMMIALDEGKIDLGKYDWILGNRPRRWMEQKPSFYLKYAQNVKGFHTYVPKYAQLPGHKLEEAATNYSCGHVAADYVCRIMKATEVHMYGFDSMFDMNLASYTDNFLVSDRSALNVHRMASNWRPIWTKFFTEFKDTKFVIHHSHADIKMILPENVTVEVGKLDGEDGEEG